MNIYPFNDVVQAVTEILEGTHTGKSFLTMKALVGKDARAIVYQQFNCAGCGAKQTMDDPNTLYESGTCEECGAVTDIKRDGCNYAVYFIGKKAQTSP